MQHQFGIDIPLNFPIGQYQGRFENQNIAILLQISISGLVLRNISDKNECFWDTVFVRKVNTEPGKIQYPSLLADGEIQILAIDESVVVGDCFQFHPK